jgi:polyhydroxyalkanoate synthesis regulator phasin
MFKTSGPGISLRARALAAGLLLSGAAGADPASDAAVAPAKVSETPEPAGAAGAPAVAELTPSELAAEELSRKASRLRQLVEGTLDPSVKAQSLLSVKLEDSQGIPELSLLALLKRAEQLSKRPLAMRKLAFRKLPDESSDPAEAARYLFEMRAAFLALPAKDRKTILERHAQRRYEAEAENQKVERQRRRLQELTERTRTLEAFLDGSLDPNVDPTPLLQVDLTDPTEVFANESRRQRFLESSQVSAAAVPPSDAHGSAESPEKTEASLEQRLEAAESALDAVRRKIVAAPREKLDQMLEALRARQAKAQAEPEVTDAVQKKLGEAEDKAHSSVHSSSGCCTPSPGARERSRSTRPSSGFGPCGSSESAWSSSG